MCCATPIPSLDGLQNLSRVLLKFAQLACVWNTEVCVEDCLRHPPTILPIISFLEVIGGKCFFSLSPSFLYKRESSFEGSVDKHDNHFVKLVPKYLILFEGPNPINKDNIFPLKISVDCLNYPLSDNFWPMFVALGGSPIPDKIGYRWILSSIPLGYCWLYAVLARVRTWSPIVAERIPSDSAIVLKTDFPEAG